MPSMSEHDPTDIRGQERRQEEGSRKAQLLTLQEAEDFKWIMSNKRGRRFVWRLLEQAGVYRTSFTGNSETFFNEGRRSYGLRVLAMIHEHTPEAYAQMLSEKREQERTNDH